MFKVIICPPIYKPMYVFFIYNAWLEKHLKKLNFVHVLMMMGNNILGEINDLIVTNLKTTVIKNLLCQISQNQWLNENIY